MCFEHYAPDIQFYSRPSYFGYVWKAKSAKGRGAKRRERRTDGGRRKGDAPHPACGHLLPIGCGEGKSGKQKAEWKRVRGYANPSF